MARTKIIDGQLDTVQAQAGRRLQQAGQIAVILGFGNFQTQQAPGQPVVFQQRDHAVGKGHLRQGRRGNVDRDLYLHA